MKMPVVSLNQMAMNESVAATCCFKVDTINGSVYETVLSGGAINVVTENVIKYKDAVCTLPGCWLSIKGDFTPALNGDHLAIKKDLFGNSVYCSVDAGGAVTGILLAGDLTSAGYAGDTVSIQWTLDGGVQTYNLITDHSHRYCDHQGLYCDYVEDITQQFVRKHVGSTVEHTAGGKNWAGAHTAMRFNS